MSESVVSEVRQFIVQNFLFGQERTDLTPDRSLLEAGIVDSTGLLEMVAFLEEHYGITVDDADLSPKNMDSIAAIAAYVAGKTSASGVAR